MSWDELFSDPDYMKKNEEEDWSELSDISDEDDEWGAENITNELKKRLVK